MSHTKKWGLTGLAILLVSGAWAGAAAWSSHQVNSLLHHAAQNGWPDSSIRIRNLSHQAGWFTSSGHVELAFVDKCSHADSQPTWLEVHYNMSHQLSPTSMMQFEWRLQPTGDDKLAFEKIFEGTIALNGQGHMRFDQSIDTDLHLPALSSTSAKRHWQLSPTAGFIHVGSDKLTLDVHTDLVSLRGQGDAVNVHQLNIQLDLDSQQHGTGNSAISFAKIEDSDLSLEGLKLSSKAHRQDGRFSMNMAYTLDKASYQQHQLSDLTVTYVVNGLHADSVSQLIALSGATCGFQNLTRNEHQQMRSALKTLLTQGLSTGFSQLHAKVSGGEVHAQLMFDLGKSDTDTVELSQHLQAQGSLTMNGQVLTAEQQQSMLDVGFAKPSAKGLQASLHYAANKLLLNDKPYDSSLVPMMLREMDNSLNAFLNNERQDHAHMLQSLLPAISEAEMPSADPSLSTSER